MGRRIEPVSLIISRNNQLHWPLFLEKISHGEGGPAPAEPLPQEGQLRRHRGGGRQLFDPIGRHQYRFWFLRGAGTPVNFDLKEEKLCWLFAATIASHHGHLQQRPVGHPLCMLARGQRI